MSLDLLISPYSSQNRYKQHQLRIMLQAEAKQQCFCGRGRMGWKKKCITNECITNRVVQKKAWRPPKYLISPQAGTQSAGLAYIYCTSLSYNKRTKKYIYLRAFFFLYSGTVLIRKDKAKESSRDVVCSNNDEAKRMKRDNLPPRRHWTCNL